MDPITLNLSEYDRTKFIELLDENLARRKALRDLRHTTEAEKQVFIYEMALLQSVRIQIEGVGWQPASGAPDWSAAEKS